MERLHLNIMNSILQCSWRESDELNRQWLSGPGFAPPSAVGKASHSSYLLPSRPAATLAQGPARTLSEASTAPITVALVRLATLGQLSEKGNLALVHPILVLLTRFPQIHRPIRVL